MRKEIDINKAIRMYSIEKLPSPVVSKAVGCCVQTLVTRLREAGVSIRSCGNHMEKVAFEIIKYEYVDLKRSTSTIAEKYGMNQASVWERLHKGGVQMRDRKEEARRACTKIPVSEHSKICHRYVDNPSDNAAIIGRDYGVHKTTITAILKRGGITPEHFGARIPSWKGGITPFYKLIRNSEKAQLWKRTCLERDNFTCMFCSARGVKLHVHHIVRFSYILDRFLLLSVDVDKSQLFVLAMKHEQFWDIDNGQTLCESCHVEKHS